MLSLPLPVLGFFAAIAFALLVRNLSSKWAKDIGPYYGPQKITLTTGKTPAEIHRKMMAARRNRQMTIFMTLVVIWGAIEYFYPEFAQRTRYAAAELAFALVDATIGFLEYIFDWLVQYLAPKG